MSNADSKHWTNDQDLLERFVLGNLEKETQQHLERHLANCADCSNAVRLEREVVAGIRRYGREEMKARLKKAVEASPREARYSLSWQKMASIAAVLVVVIGIGYYGRIFRVLEGNQITSREQAEKKDLAAQLQANKEEVPKPEATPKNRLEADSKISLQGDLAAKKEADAFRSDKREESSSLALKELKGDVAQDMPVSAAPTGAGQVSALKKTSEGLASLPSMGDEAGLWTEGKILRETVSAKGPIPAGKSDRIAAQGLKLANRPAPTERTAGSSKMAVTQKWIVKQQLISQLPGSRQQLHQENQRTIQTHVGQSSDGMTMTLYLDTLYPKSVIDSARIEEIQPDSIVLHVQSTRIGYQLQGELLQRLQAPAKSKK
jgi:hypothetical protein